LVMNSDITGFTTPSTLITIMSAYNDWTKRGEKRKQIKREKNFFFI